MDFNFNLDERNVYSYAEYRKLINDLVAEGKTTGGNHSESYMNYTTMNVRRMNRLDKRFELSEADLDHFSQVENQTWIVLTEAWCGDAAQSLPIINAVAANSKNISLKLVLRDQNLDIMDAFLTNGGRSIPKLIAVNENKEILFTWGPRPSIIQEKYWALKKEGLEYIYISKQIHTMYAKDKGVSVLKELRELVDVPAFN